MTHQAEPARRIRRRSSLAFVFLAFALCIGYPSARPQAREPVAATGAAPPPDQGQVHHPALMETVPGYSRCLAHYDMPDVALVGANGDSVKLRALLSEPRPVLVQFIFTSCSTICPMMAATFSTAQAGLTKAHPGYRLVSISIDPEYDTPERLKDFAERFKAGPDWLFLTGTERDVAQVLRAFDAYYPGNNKMYHRPYTFLRAAPERPWVRLDGLLSATELVAEYRRALREGDVAVAIGREAENPIARQSPCE
jgi:protein SCO1/2